MNLDRAPGSGWVTRGRLAAMVAAFLLVALAIGYTVHAATRTGQDLQTQGQAAPAYDPGLYVRRADGTVVVQEATEGEPGAGGRRTGTGLSCFRFYVAGSTVVCLQPRGGLRPQTRVLILDRDLTERQRIDFGGTPNRARVSPSGRMVSWTVFVTGDDYSTTGFSTRSGILDTETGYLVKSVETLQLSIDGERYGSPDVNYWGITFADDDNRFYATMSTRGKTYLVEGDVAKWTAKALRTNVECPSLSPDGTRLAFKKRVREGADDPWRLHVLDLATMRETPLAETRSVDDQVEWLDDGTVAYALGQDVWSVPADGSGEPVRVATGASSPVMVPLEDVAG